MVMTEESSVGKINMSLRFVNLSSLHPTMIKLMLMRVTDSKSDINIVPFATIAVFSSKSGQPLVSRNKKLLLNFVVDDDDKKYNIKIRNTIRLLKAVAAGVLVLKSNYKPKETPPRRSGEVTRFMNSTSKRSDAKGECQAFDSKNIIQFVESNNRVDQRRQGRVNRWNKDGVELLNNTL